MGRAESGENPIGQALSAVPGVVWPALPSGHGAAVLALIRQLDETQWWSPEALEAQQFRQLSILVEHAWRTVPYYRSRLEAAGYSPGRAVDPGLWRRVDPLTRAEAQAAGPGLNSDDVPKKFGQIGEKSTSGSTGQPLVVRKTELDQLFWSAFTLRDHLWQERDFSRSFAAIRRFPDGVARYPEGAKGATWDAGTKVTYRTGPAYGLTIFSSVAEQAEWLSRIDPAYLLSYPSNLAALAEHCRARDIVLPGLRLVGTFGELVSAETREIVREVWGRELADVYSSQEVGYLALQCPQAAHYHVQSEGVLLEVVNESGEPCGPGEIGRVLITSLHAFGTLLLRYELGDYAEVGEPCSCGRGLPVLNRIVGRVRNMLVLPNGDRYWPAFGMRKLVKIAPVKQILFVQTTLDTIEINLSVFEPLSPEQEEALRQHLQRLLPQPFNFLFKYHDELPRSQGGKQEDFRCEVKL